jgi:hypothetical protein
MTILCLCPFLRTSVVSRSPNDEFPGFCFFIAIRATYNELDEARFLGCDLMNVENLGYLKNMAISFRGENLGLNLLRRRENIKKQGQNFDPAFVNL